MAASANRQATGSIATDVGDLYKRLLNHRPVIQNEVHFFLKEFEVKREDNGLRHLQDAMKFANEMDAIFLEEITSSSNQFKQINTLIDTVNKRGGQVLDNETSNLGIPKSEQEALGKQVEDCRRLFNEKQEQYDTDRSKQVEQLKEEIQHERDAREKLRPPSQTTSVGSSVAIFPPEAQSVDSSSPDGSGDSESPAQASPEGGREGEALPSEEESEESQQQTSSVDSESKLTEDS